MHKHSSKGPPHMLCMCKLSICGTLLHAAHGKCIHRLHPHWHAFSHQALRSPAAAVVPYAELRQPREQRRRTITAHAEALAHRQHFQSLQAAKIWPKLIIFQLQPSHMQLAEPAAVSCGSQQRAVQRHAAQHQHAQLRQVAPAAGVLLRMGAAGLLLVVRTRRLASCCGRC